MRASFGGTAVILTVSCRSPLEPDTRAGFYSGRLSPTVGKGHVEIPNRLRHGAAVRGCGRRVFSCAGDHDRRDDRGGWRRRLS